MESSKKKDSKAEDKMKDIGEVNEDANQPLPIPDTNLPLRIPNTYEPLLSRPVVMPPTNEPLIHSKKSIISQPIKTPFYFEILKYILPKEIPNKSLLRKGILIKIADSLYSYIIEGQQGENFAHEGRLQFGREGHINFEVYDPTISRKQFLILLQNDSIEISCLCTPPKMPTSIVITQEPFYLSKDNVCFYK